MTAQNTNTMTVLVGIDQKSAIRNGIAADSTARITFDPAQLPDPIRNWIADRFWSGELREDGRSTSPLVAIAEPTIGALVGHATMDLERKVKEETQRWDAAQQVMANAPETRTVFARWNNRANCLETQGQRYGAPTLEVSFPHRQTYALGFSPTSLSADHFEQWNQWVDEATRQNDSARQAALDAVLPQLRHMADQWDAEQAQARAESERAAALLKSQMDAAVAIAGTTAAARWQAGYMAEEEALGFVKCRELKERGLTYTGDAEDWGYEEGEEITTLTDAQFEAFSIWKKKVPADAAITLFRLDRANAESPAGVDSIVVAEATWTVGQVQVTADTAL